MRSKWTEEDEKYLVEWYGEKSADEIAVVLGKSVRSVYYKAQRLGISGRSRVWTEEDLLFLKENYVKLGARETARILGRTLASVSYRIAGTEKGYPSLGPRRNWTEEEAEFLRENYQELGWDELQDKLGRNKAALVRKARAIGIKRYIDPYPFFEKWTEESAYVLGFFAADGWITKRGPQSIRIGFSQKEPDIIYLLRKIMGTGRITEKSNGMYEYYIHSQKTYDYLCDVFGCEVHRKSKTILWPNVPDEYIRHFIRGATDGDGSLFLTRDGLWSYSYATSSEQFVNGMKETTFSSAGIDLSVGQNKTSVYHARVTGIGAVCMATWLYKRCSIALERKKAIAERIMHPRGTAQRASITNKMKGMFSEVLSTYNIW